MKFFVTDQSGLSRIDPGAQERRRILDAVESDAEADYPDVYLTSGTGPVIGYRRGGYLLWEADGEVVRTLSGVNPERAAQAWDLILAGELDALASWPWQDLA